MTDTMHDAGDPTRHGVTQRAMARARIDALFDFPTAARLHAACLHGTA